jgi:hypothetical protein
VRPGGEARKRREEREGEEGTMERERERGGERERARRLRIAFLMYILDIKWKNILEITLRCFFFSFSSLFSLSLSSLFSLSLSSLRPTGSVFFLSLSRCFKLRTKMSASESSRPLLLLLSPSSSSIGIPSVSEESIASKIAEIGFDVQVKRERGGEREREREEREREYE